MAVSIRDLQGVEGYSLMTIGYPLTVQLTGPGMSMSHNVRTGVRGLRQSSTQTGLCSEKRSRNLKSQMGCSYLCSENKVADQLCGISVLYKHDSEEIPTQTPKNKSIHNIEYWFVTHIC